MMYIILDLEWDNSYLPSKNRFINQILQIGAVKLNKDFEILDTFEATIKSSFTKRVSGRFSRLTGITNETMRSGIPLETAVKAYNEWIGTDTVTMTWSTSDLFSIIDNEKLLLNNLRFKIDKYLDLQSFIQNEIRMMGVEITSQISLLNAANILKITADELSLHSAKYDSLLCAALLKKCYQKERFEAMIKDTSNPEFFERLCFKPYYISDIKSGNINKEHMKFNCDICGSKGIRKSKWRYRNRWFVADFFCKKCSREFSGRVSFKKTYDNLIVKRKICEVKKKEEGQDEVQSVSSPL
ncbi:MAG: hypothetical protein J6J13_00475 [Clostridia bacterium]|nr:hypothetical protein [Clostridia bacterium]